MVKGAEKPVRSANAGELSRDFAGRVDVKQYYSGALRMKGFEPVPQGGFRLMPGTIDLGPARGSLVALAQTSPTTSNGPHTGTQTIFSATVAGAVSLIHWQNVSVNAGTISVVAEINPGDGNWVAIGPAMTIGQVSTSRTFAFPPSLARVATAVRLRATFSTSATVTQGTTTIFAEHATAFTWPRYRVLRQSQAQGYFFAVHEGFCDIFKGDAWTGAVRLTASLTEAMLADLGFYAEQSTFGIFHGDLETRRLRRVGGNDHEWAVDLWPYEGIPTVDYGAVYPKIDDKWEVFLRWSEDGQLYVTFEVDGESTPGIPLRNGSGTPVSTSTASGGNWPNFATEVQTEINNLPSTPAGVTVTQESVGDNNARKLVITFGGAATGREYNLVATAANRASASALAYHIQTGKTEFEAIISAARGWPGRADLVQDRLSYSRLKGQPAALSLSQVGEYFNINIKAVGAAAARLDRLRVETSETILAVRESKYLIVFTDQNVWFGTNRAFSATEPPNFVIASEIGIRANCEPIELQGEIFYVSNNGQMILGGRYDELETGFVFTERTIVNSHLVEGMRRTARQAGSSDTDAARIWLLREDGRLIQGQMIASQEIFGLAEWLAADSDPIKELASDDNQDIRLCLDRGGRPRHERMQADALFQQQRIVSTDLGGSVSGLPYEDGTVLWAEDAGAVYGPFTCQGGAIDLGGVHANAKIGRWRAPVFEDMPHVYILPSDEVVWRPGRIHSVSMNLIDTTSIAVGANGQDAENVPLLSLEDPANQPMPPKSGLFTVTGLLGSAIGTTVTFTQTRPGRLRIRDYSTGEKL